MEAQFLQDGTFDIYLSVIDEQRFLGLQLTSAAPVSYIGKTFWGYKLDFKKIVSVIFKGHQIF